MARVKGAMMTRKRRNKVLKLAKSYWGSKSRHFKMAKQAVYKSGVYAYVGRKLKKREFRNLWICLLYTSALRRKICQSSAYTPPFAEVINSTCILQTLDV